MDSSGGESVQLKVNIPAKVRRELEAAASEHGWTLNREVVGRIERSLIVDETMSHWLGGAHTAKFLRLAAALIETIEARTGYKWTEDSRTWAAVASMLHHVVHDSDPTKYTDLSEDTRAEVKKTRREIDLLWDEMEATDERESVQRIVDKLKEVKGRLREIDPVAAGEKLGLDVVNEQFAIEDGEQPD